MYVVQQNKSGERNYRVYSFVHIKHEERITPEVLCRTRNALPTQSTLPDRVGDNSVPLILENLSFDFSHYWTTIRR